MGIIRTLPRNIVNQIAAGEVIERPYSIIKELVENSLDANAKNIEIVIEHAGKSFISVKDDGDGIMAEDLHLAIKPHSTSKLQGDNLFKIRNLGFRGEALASINSVSMLKIESRHKDCNQGYEISNLNQTYQPGSIEKGTKVSVSSLFYNIPARLKFLKSDSYETSLCYKMIKQIAISNPHVSFKIINNNKIVKNYISKGLNHKSLLLNRIQEILGANFFNNSIFIEEITPILSIYGYIINPTKATNKADNQFLVINGRAISDKSLKGIINFAYSDTLFNGLKPSYIMFIHINENEIDVNVNPTKSEVRFKDLQLIRHIFLSTIKNHIKNIKNQSKNKIIINSTTEIKKPLVSEEIFKTLHTDNYQEDITNLLKENINNNLEQSFSIAKEENISDEKIDNHNDESSTFPLGIAKAQVHKNWIISQTQEGFIIVDQHAAHERIRQENLQKAYQNKLIQKQLLLTPEIINLDPQEVEIINTYKNEILKLGIDLEQFGEDVIIVNAIPSLLGNINVKQMIEDILYELKTIESIEIVEHKINNIISKMACVSSIRSGKTLSINEMNALLRQMENTENYAQCSHGRPTYINIELNELEKLFKRK